VGFQLSFLALLGIVLISPLLMPLFRRFPGIVAETLTMTFAAQAAVLPLLLVSFGQVSLIAPLSNLLVVPATAPVMVWSITASLAGVLWLPLGQLLALPLLPFFLFVVWVAEGFGALPVAEARLSIFGAGAVTLLWYGTLFWFVRRKNRKRLLPAAQVRAGADT
jgi:competence protein ComEC